MRFFVEEVNGSFFEEEVNRLELGFEEVVDDVFGEFVVEDEGDIVWNYSFF